MKPIDYIVIAIYFIGLVVVSLIMSRKIKSSEDMFIAGRNSSWWLSGLSTYMTLFSAGTFVIWGGVAYRSGLVAAVVGMTVGLSSFLAGKYLAGRWREMRIKSPGEFLVVRFGGHTIDFYTIAGIVGRGVHTAVALYAIAVVVSALVELPGGGFLADSTGHLSVSWAVTFLGIICLFYTVTGGFLAVLMTDMIQFGVLLTMVVFMIPLSVNEVGGMSNFVNLAPEGFFDLFSNEYTMLWMVLWFFLNAFMIGGDWPFVQRYLSIPTKRDARRSNYLVGALYLATPIIWYLPAMCFRILEPNANPEQAYVFMSQRVLMNGMLGVMLAAMVSATLSTVSGTLNVFANVFTYDIYCTRRSDTPEPKRIRIGRVFTFVYGLTILVMALLIPYAGGAEKVVVTILTLVISPLYIPCVWAVFSRRITGRQVMLCMAVTYALGFTMKAVLSGKVSSTLLESSIGLLLPCLLLGAFEVYDRLRGKTDCGYDRIQALIEPEENMTPTEEDRQSARSISYVAINCFVATLTSIAILLTVLLMTDDYEPYTTSVMTGGAALMYIISLLYFGARYFRSKSKKTVSGGALADS